MKHRTKLVRNAGSIRTTVPVALVNLLNLKEGDKLCWDVDITGEGAIITIIPEPSKSKE